MNNYPDWLLFIIIPLAIWSLFWKALALWHAARRGSRVWFVVLLLVNTVGILEITYLIMIGKLKTGELFGSSAAVDTEAKKQ
jgi:methionyl-tRNA synthetase